jgi:hypothetical protein
MSRLPNHAMRSGALAVGVAAGLMVLASTTQSPDGFVTSALRGPLEALGGSAPAEEADLLAIGAGSSDIGEIAAIATPGASNPGASNPGVPQGLTDPSVQAAYDAGMSVSAAPTGDAALAAPAYKQSLDLPRVPVVDAQGQIDCTGSVSCLTDPVTKVTTVTYPDGVVALVQQVNDMTVVAYKSLTEALPAPFQALMPPAFTPTFTPPGGPAPLPAASVPAVKTPAPQTGAPSVDAPSPDATPPSAGELPGFGASISRPRVVVTKPSQDLGPGQNESATGPGAIKIPAVKIPAVKPTSPLDVVKDAIGSVVGAVTGNKAPSKTIRPPTAPTADSSGQDSVGQDSSGQDSSDSAGGDQ